MARSVEVMRELEDDEPGSSDLPVLSLRKRRPGRGFHFLKGGRAKAESDSSRSAQQKE